ncbi:MAG: hypothetical protein H6707_12090 [Deltaproteobacteria bacterium]|nr:hypothetical protein [Deltaproteobacteria bacterium]
MRARPLLIFTCRSLCLTLVLGIGQLTAAKRSSAPPPRRSPQKTPEQQLAERISEALEGLPVTLKQLRFDLLGRRFIGRGLQIGVPGAKGLRVVVEQFSAKLGFGYTAERLELSGVSARVPRSVAEKWLGKVRRGSQLAALKVGGLRIAATLLELNDRRRGKLLRFTDSEITIDDLTSGGGTAKGAALSGRWRISAKHLGVVGALFEHVVLNGSLRDGLVLVFAPSRLRLAQMPAWCRSASGRSGVSISLTAGEFRPLVGQLALDGTLSLPRAEQLLGRFSIKGRLTRLRLTGQVDGDVQLSVGRGGLQRAWPLSLDLRLGKRRLVGTSRRWRLR